MHFFRQKKQLSKNHFLILPHLASLRKCANKKYFHAQQLNLLPNLRSQLQEPSAECSNQDPRVRTRVLAHPMARIYIIGSSPPENMSNNLKKNIMDQVNANNRSKFLGLISVVGRSRNVDDLVCVMMGSLLRHYLPRICLTIIYFNKNPTMIFSSMHTKHCKIVQYCNYYHKEGSQIEIPSD